jgi:sugar-phosphatase
MTEFPCRAVLFDCDGVLVDSDAAVVDAWTRWAIDLGFDPAEVLADVHGQRSIDTVDQWLPAERRVAELDRIDRYELESVATVRPVPGAPALAATVPLEQRAVVTSGRTDLAVARLRAADIALPSVLVCADDVRRGKPDPEGYLLAAHRLGVDPADAIVLEDAPAGIAAARAAGVRSVIGIGPRARAVAIDGWAADLRSLQWSGEGLRLVP